MDLFHLPLLFVLSFNVVSSELGVESQQSDEYSEMDRRLLSVEKFLISETNARTDLGKKVLELSTQLESENNLTISLQADVANLTAELNEEREVRQELQLQLDHCHANGSQNINDNSLSLLLQDNQQQIQILKENARNVTSRFNVIQRQYRKLSLSFLDLQHEMSSMNDTNQDLREHFKNMTSKMKDYEHATKLMYDDAMQQIISLKRYEVEYKKNVTDILDNMQTEVRQLALSVHDDSGFLANINGTMVNLQSSVELLDAKMDAVETGPIQNMTSNISLLNIVNKVLFSAILRTPNLTNLAENHTIPFNSLITSFGGGFNPRDGKFTARLPGYYVFQWEIQTRPGSLCDVALVKNENGNRILSTTADARAGNSTSSQLATNLVILLLKKNDKVWIMNGKCDHIYGKGYSSFSGWKIR